MQKNVALKLASPNFNINIQINSSKFDVDIKLLNKHILTLFKKKTKAIINSKYY